MIFDITERKKAREALQRAKEEWERTFDAVPALIDVSDKDLRILKVNAAFAHRLGMPREDIVGAIATKCFMDMDGRKNVPNIHGKTPSL